MVLKIVSGCQTGVDRAAADYAIEKGIPQGGFCPRGRRSESGRISDKYNLTETSSSNYPQRTRMNVLHSDGTLIITQGVPSGGTKLTINFCRELRKPFLVVNLQYKLNVQEFSDWVRNNNVRTLNVAGPRESSYSGIGKRAKQALEELFAGLV